MENSNKKGKIEGMKKVVRQKKERQVKAIVGLIVEEIKKLKKVLKILKKFMLKI